jgi:exosortase B
VVADSEREAMVASRGFKQWDIVAAGAIVIGLLLLYVPTFYRLANTIWSKDEQGHGPIILAVSFWLVYRSRDEYFKAIKKPAGLAGGLVFAVAMVFYIVGHSQRILSFEVVSLLSVIVSLVLIFGGWALLKKMWFPLFFLIFMIPLPATLVITLTTPLKSAVSAVASSILYSLNYPVGRTGVVLTVGQYQLLVADACSGLNSMFTLEALGLLYMNLMGYKSASRNIFLAVMIIPISFVANVSRVMILVLVTYYFGDEAGQGFVHSFAGMVLFLVALTQILVFDKGLYAITRARGRSAP